MIWLRFDGSRDRSDQQGRAQSRTRHLRIGARARIRGLWSYFGSLSSEAAQPSQGALGLLETQRAGGAR